jgi:hypothetical protein
VAEQVRVTGTGVATAFVDHCAGRGFNPPRGPGHGSPGPAPDASAPPALTPAARYYAVAVAGAAAPTDLLCQEVGTGGGARQLWLGPAGWLPREGLPPGARTTELPPATAARLADHLCARWHGQLRELAVETRTAPTENGRGLRLARVYDRQDAGGAVWFSPHRLRLSDAGQRERLAAYLSGGRIVLRATGHGPDPLAPHRDPVLPLHFRTDGEWVWSEALAYYVRQRGIAPELALLCHIEERAVADPTHVTDEIARQAVAVAARPAPLLAPVSTVYHRGVTGELFRERNDPRASEQLGPEWLGDDLRWRRCPAEARVSPSSLLELSEREVARELDLRWSRLVGRPA